MTVDVASHHILIAVLPTIHRKIIRSSLVLNMVKAFKFIFKLIFSFLCFAMAASLSIARYLIILLLINPDTHLSNTLPLDWSKLLLVVTVPSSTHYHLLLLPATASFVHVLLLLLMVDVTADAYLLGDLWQL